MESTIIGEFATRREAELAVEHVVQEFGVARGDVFIQPAGAVNSSGTQAAGADAKAPTTPEGYQRLAGEIEVSVYFHGDKPREDRRGAEGAGAKTVRRK